MEIEKLSIAYLKTAWDFVKENLKEIEETAKQKNISTDKIPVYDEVKAIETKLYDRLLNLTRDLK